MLSLPAGHGRRTECCTPTSMVSATAATRIDGGQATGWARPPSGVRARSASQVSPAAAR
ncbi:MAG TPA: hypothetical protein VF933_01325 [Streptosporangiaceae bacterium]